MWEAIAKMKALTKVKWHLPGGCGLATWRELLIPEGRHLRCEATLILQLLHGWGLVGVDRWRAWAEATDVTGTQCLGWLQRWLRLSRWDLLGLMGLLGLIAGAGLLGCALRCC